LPAITYTPVFIANKAAFEALEYDTTKKEYYHKHRVIANEGSTRSSKTFSEIQLVCWIARHPEIYGTKEISIVSPSLPHLKKGARKDFLQIAGDWKFFNEDHFNRTDNIYYVNGGPSYIEFFGAENNGKVRGPGRDILIMNEANLVGYDVYKQLALRTKEIIFLDYNPADEFSWVYTEADKPGNKKIHSTYLNNKGNLTRAQIEEIESLKDADINLWNVYGLGLRGTSQDTIYTHYKLIDQLPRRGEIIYGQDFGYNVASALIEIEIFDNKLYWNEIIYETKLTTADLIERYKNLNISKRTEIFCDAAEPKTIEEIKRAGYNAKAAAKEVFEGIRKVKSMPLYVTRGSTNLLKEIKSYKWKTKEENGVTRAIDEPVKFNDHALDAGRYATFTKLGKAKKYFGVLHLPDLE
jgi:phage terminase large subunit